MLYRLNGGSVVKDFFVRSDSRVKRCGGRDSRKYISQNHRLSQLSRIGSVEFFRLDGDDEEQIDTAIKKRTKKRGNKREYKKIFLKKKIVWTVFTSSVGTS